MTPKLLRIIGGVLLILWGSLNSIGGLLAASDHPSPLIPPLFAIVGLSIVIAGVGLMIAQKWAIPLSAIALVLLSLAALYSGITLRGWSDLNLTHHLVRLFISGIIFFIGTRGQRMVKG